MLTLIYGSDIMVRQYFLTGRSLKMQQNEKRGYRGTVIACYIAYMVQALVNNTSPLLFVLYQSEYNISLQMLANIILINFGTQFVFDIISIKLIDIFGYRKLSVACHIISALGLIGLGIFPKIMPPSAGLVIATLLCAVGGGLIEVIISPIVDAIPNESKSASMNFLHSFYCWGSVFCVAVGTVAVKLLGNMWYILPICLSAIPLFNSVAFMRAKFAKSTEDNVRVPAKKLLRSPFFILLMIIMICGGASELVISQWASLFAEKALGISKVAGDILGPCLFAFFMGTGRMLSGVLSKKIKIEKIMLVCAVLCTLCYIGTALLPGAFALATCALTGFGVSLMWPATLSVASAHFDGAGTTLFSILAFAGDIGCAFGPWLSGNISDLVEGNSAFASVADSLSLTTEQLGLRSGILVSAIFPIIIFFSLTAVLAYEKKHREESLI